MGILKRLWAGSAVSGENLPFTWPQGLSIECLHVISLVQQSKGVEHKTLNLRASKVIDPIDHGVNYKDSYDVAI